MAARPNVGPWAEFDVSGRRRTGAMNATLARAAHQRDDRPRGRLDVSQGIVSDRGSEIERAPAHGHGPDRRGRAEAAFVRTEQCGRGHHVRERRGDVVRRDPGDRQRLGGDHARVHDEDRVKGK